MPGKLQKAETADQALQRGTGATQRPVNPEVFLLVLRSWFWSLLVMWITTARRLHQLSRA
jgi:hypothetical protein